ncbi:MAG: hypothetical protein PHT96_00985 [Syntrophorhabdaceae bacterium]|nr:hypothetical protein [Syntrophorhabdaceae bacterium]
MKAGKDSSLENNKTTGIDYRWICEKYSYMNNDLPLQGWIWEFVRRTREYQTLYEKAQLLSKEFPEDPEYQTAGKMCKTILEFFEQVFTESQQIFERDIYWGSRTQERAGNLEFLSKCRGLSSLFVFAYTYINNEQMTIRFAHPFLPYTGDLCNLLPTIRGVYPFRCYVPDRLAFPESPVQITRGDIIKIPKVSGLNMVDNTMADPQKLLYICVARDAKIEVLEKALLPAIRRYLKPAKTKLRTDKWKYYFIVYDLKKYYPEITYQEIANKLQDAYPEMKRIFDEKSSENYYKNALNLIKGGYKKYLYRL